MDLAHIVSTIDGVKNIPVEKAENGGVHFGFKAEPGLYQFSNIVDAKDYNWDSLYFNLDKYNNTGQLTGPWFITLEKASPLVPAWWVYLDGKKLGIWMSQRMSIKDIENKRFRANMAFYVDKPGEHTLTLVPYKDDYKINWMTARLERDPDDKLIDLPKMRKVKDSVLFADWSNGAFWEKQNELLGSTHSIYKEPLERSFTYFSDVKDDWHLYNHIIALIVAEKLGGRAGSIEKAVGIIDKYIEKPAWNGLNEDGYNYNGDKTAGIIFRALAQAYHILGDELGADRKQKLRDKLAYQGNQFFTMSLIGRDGWGGSVIQDHGWRAMFAFGAGTLYLIDDVPDAKLWARYIIPRLDRCVDAIPRDGTISPASYMTPCLYLHELMHYREALLALTGRDIFDEGPFAKIPDCIRQLMRKDDAVLHAGPHAMRTWNGGEMFLNRIAQKYNDRTAAWIHERFVKIPEPKCTHNDYADGHFNGILWGFFTYDPSIKPQAPEYRPRHLAYFDDTGLVHYRNGDTGMTFSLLCGAWPSAHSYRKVNCASDRLKLAPIDGHFLVYIEDKPLLIQSEGAYQPHTYMGNCMLVDGRGQYGSIGYPCSISNWDYLGEQIEKVHWDDKTGEGFVRLNLKPSYPKDMGMTLYYRDFIITSGKKLICRDQVVFDEPHTLSWLFQAQRSVGISVDENLQTTIGSGPRLFIDPQSPQVSLTAKIEETPVVYAYYSHSDWDPYDHVEYKTAKPIANITVDFEITW